MRKPFRIWHHGLVARWWSEFNVGGPDVEYFVEAVAQSGEPVHDAGCGTGRLLLPFLRLGLDADGSDASTAMLDACQRSVEAERLETALHAQALHELDLARRYRTILVCGAFGLGGSREDDLEGLRRIREHLQLGGTLIMDHYPPEGTANPRTTSNDRKAPTRDWPEVGDRRRACDGSELELRVRIRDFDPDQRTVTQEICVRHFEGENEIAKEIYAIDINLYSRSEIEAALQSAGFADVRVTGELFDRPALPSDERVVFYAKA